jgi:hypothetical protein
MTMRERANLYCTECGSADGLTNDYERHTTANFLLAGGDWPGKRNKLESDIVRDRYKD